MYYVIHKLDTLSKVTIHLGMHDHPIANGKCKEVVEKIKSLVEV
jgi:hypothetical protein